MAAKKTPDGVAQRYELSRLGVFALRHSMFLKCQFDRQYVFPKEEKVPTMWQATLRSLGITDESGLGYQSKDGPSQPYCSFNFGARHVLAEACVTGSNPPVEGVSFNPALCAAPAEFEKTSFDLALTNEILDALSIGSRYSRRFSQRDPRRFSPS